MQMERNLVLVLRKNNVQMCKNKQISNAIYERQLSKDLWFSKPSLRTRDNSWQVRLHKVKDQVKAVLHSWSGKAFKLDNIWMVQLLQYHNLSWNKSYALRFWSIKLNFLQSNYLSSITILGFIHIAVSSLPYLHQNECVSNS